MNKKIQIAMLAAILALVMLLSACGVPTLKYDAAQKGYVRNSDGIVFRAAPQNYVAAAMDTENPIAKLVLEDKKLNVYTVCGTENGTDMDTNVWLADEEYKLYCADGTVLPKLWEMQVNRISILQNTTEAFGMGRVTDADEIATVVDAYQNGPTYSAVDLRHVIALLTYRTDYNKYTLSFSSANYAGLCYTLTFYHFESDVYLTPDGSDEEPVNVGKNIILDPETGLCYAVRGVFDVFFHKSAE